MTTLTKRIDRDQAEFVPPEPSAAPPPIDWKHIPRWVQIAIVISVIAIGVLAIWLSR